MMQDWMRQLQLRWSNRCMDKGRARISDKGIFLFVFLDAKKLAQAGGEGNTQNKLSKKLHRRENIALVPITEKKTRSVSINKRVRNVGQMENIINDDYF